MRVIGYTVQEGPFGSYIQAYASFLENVVEGFKLGRPALLYVKLVKDGGASYFYYARYGGGLGKLNISVPEWFAGKGERINVFFKAVSDDESIDSLHSYGEASRQANGRGEESRPRQRSSQTVCQTGAV